MNSKLDLKKVEKISKALGDPCRLKMMDMINKQKDPMQCADILEQLDHLAQSTVSHHLKQLVEAELLIPDKDGRSSNYQVNTEVFASYIKFLSSFES